MKINEVFSKKLRLSKNGVNVTADVDAVVAGAIDERRAHDRATSRRRSRIVQQGGDSAEGDLGVEGPPINPNLAPPVDAAVAFNRESDQDAERDS